MAKTGTVQALKVLFHKKDAEGEEFRTEFLAGVYQLLKKHNIELTKALVKNLDTDGASIEGAKFP